MIRGGGGERKPKRVRWDGVRKRKKRRKTTDLWQEEDEDRRQKKRKMKEEQRRRQEVKDGDEEAKEMTWKERREGGERRGEGPPLSADKRQKWMNPIGRWASSSLLSPRLHELRTHFIEICEIRKAVYRVIYHRATPAHTSSRLHNKIHNWHFCFGFLNNYMLRQLQSSSGFLLCCFQGQTNLDWIQELQTALKEKNCAHSRS